MTPKPSDSVRMPCELAALRELLREVNIVLSIAIPETPEPYWGMFNDLLKKIDALSLHSAEYVLVPRKMLKQIRGYLIEDLLYFHPPENVVEQIDAMLTAAPLQGEGVQTRIADGRQCNEQSGTEPSLESKGI